MDAISRRTLEAESPGAAEPKSRASAVTSFEVALDETIAKRCSRIFPGVSAFLAFEALYYGLAHGLHSMGAELLFLSILASASTFVGVCEARYKTLPVSSRTLAVAVIGLALVVQIMHAWLLRDLAFFLPLAAVLFGAGFFGLPPIALSVTLGGALSIWAAIAVGQFEPVIWIPLTIAGGLLSYWSVRNATSTLDELRTGFEENLARERAASEAQQEIASLKKSLVREKRAIDAAGDGHWHWDLANDRCYYSQHWATMLGLDPGEIGAKPEEWLNRIHAFYLAQVKEDLSSHLYGRTPRFQSQFRMQVRDGSYIWALAKGVAERDKEGNPLGISGVLIDITHLVKTEKSMINEVFEDRLTGLANRKALTVRLERAVERMRQEHYLFAVIFMDLDRFKVVNDTHGHVVGDQLLASVASRLRNCLRERRGDILARFGGDEFVALLEDLREPEEAMAVARRFREVLRSPFKIGDHEIASGGSVGIAFSNTKIDCAADVLRNADTAMYRAKEERKGEIRVFNAEMYEEAVRLYTMETDLGKALERNEFLLEYQPVISMKTGDIVGAEALIRWRRSEHEIVGPGEFIPMAEESGKIEAIGQWTMEEAVRQNAHWQRAGLPPVKIAVNLSAKQLRQIGLDEAVHRILQSHGLDPRWLELELTETALMENLDAAAAMIARLQRIGLRISIDDFGTGYSSLGYLRRFPFDSLKMDRTFVADMTSDPKSLAVAKGLIRLAHNLKLGVTAEGVESAEQLRHLARFGCDQFQGYFASRPVGAQRFEEMLTNRERLVGPIGPADAESVSIDIKDLGGALRDLASADRTAPSAPPDRSTATSPTLAYASLERPSR